MRVLFLVCAAYPLWSYFEIPLNVTYGANFIRGWPERLRHTGLVRYPLPRGRGIFTYPENAADLTALAELVGRTGPNDQPILDLSGERALYYLLDRRPAVRCPDVPMLSAPPLMREALAQLAARPPSMVILHGTKGLDEFDGVPNGARVPQIMAWIDAVYPVRMHVGRYDVALRTALP